MAALSPVTNAARSAVRGGGVGAALAAAATMFDVDFKKLAIAGAMDPRFTTSFTGLATCFNSAGNLTYRPHNLATNSNNSTNWTADSNTFNNVVTDPAGAGAVQIVAPGAGVTFPGLRNPPVVPGASYIFRAKLRIVPGNPGAANSVKQAFWNGTAWTLGAELVGTLTTAFQTFTYTFTNPTTASAFQTGIQISAGAAGVTLEVADYEIIQTLSTAIDPTGGKITRTNGAAVYGPRWDYDPVTLASKGMRLEPLASNSGVRNNTMQGAVVGTPGTLPTNWAIQNADALATARVSGTGTEFGMPYLEYTLGGTWGANGFFAFRPEAANQITALNGQTWTGSWYYRFVSVSGCTGTNCGVEENNAAGGFLANTTAADASFSTTLKRVSVTRTLNNASTAFVNQAFAVTGTNTVVMAAVIRLYMPQIEQLAAASYPIPAYGAAVARSADFCDLPLSPGLVGYNGTQGFVRVDFYADAGLGSFSRIAGGNVDNGLLSRGGGLTLECYDGTVVDSPNLITIPGLNKGIAAWDQSGKAVCLNNGSGPGGVARGTLGPPGGNAIITMTTLALGTVPTHPVAGNTDPVVGINILRLVIGNVKPANDAAIQALVA